MLRMSYKQSCLHILTTTDLILLVLVPLIITHLEQWFKVFPRTAVSSADVLATQNTFHTPVREL